jgi:hypothetical protein
MTTYPSDTALDLIEHWDLIEGDDGSHEKLYKLLDFVRDLWEYPDRFTMGRLRPHDLFKDKKVRTLYLSTGGWSGNESIIGALERNYLFWAMFWYRSQTGGHYWFKIPPRKERK